MNVNELRILLCQSPGLAEIPNDAEVVSQMPGDYYEEVITYASAGAEYDKEKNELIINIS